MRPAAAVHLKRQRSAVVRGISIDGPVPEGVQLELKAAEEGEGLEWDPSSKTLRLPVSVLEGEGGQGGRRSRLVVFTCNKCGGRTARKVNPIAWDEGLVWHVLSAKNKAIYEEIRYSDDSSQGSGAHMSYPAASLGSESSVTSATVGSIPSLDNGESSLLATNSSTEQGNGGDAHVAHSL
ncbi:hsp70 escorting protein 2 [Haematococcus lacustris]|uniref:Hsp70 escorting protein 2 n=1 Tax=Haematococcus lacustris TaxID=44745 RepID=A0A699Y7U8_HAELA|nr:hsp70 escorting protein 2 [Haematococcus lacustris]